MNLIIIRIKYALLNEEVLYKNTKYNGSREEQRLYLLRWDNWEGFKIYVFPNDEKLSQEINILEIDNETVLSWKGVLHSYNFFFLHDFCLQSLSLSVDYSSGSC